MSNAKLKAALGSALDAHTWLAGAGALSAPLDILHLIRVEGMMCPESHEMKRQASLAVKPDCHRCGQKFPHGTVFSMCKVGHVYRVCADCSASNYAIGQPAEAGLFGGLFSSSEVGSLDLEQDIIAGILRIRSSGESVEPITRLLAARLVHADVMEEAAVRYFAYKALAAIFAGRQGLLPCVWPQEVGGRAALENAFPELLLHGPFQLGTQEIQAQSLKVILLQDGISPAAFRDLAGLETEDAGKLVMLGLKAKEDQWWVMEEIVVDCGSDKSKSGFCRVEKMEGGEVHANPWTFDASTGAGAHLDGTPCRAFALEWS